MAIFRSLIFLALFLAGGCASRAPVAAPEPVVVQAVDVPVVEVVAPAANESLAEACEMLLLSLEETRPLLNNLDESLVTQADRVELAVDRMQRPPVEKPRAPECPATSDNPIGNKEIIGAIEWIYMDPPEQNFRARVDTGAETSSLSASEVVEFERDGDDWVRFNFQHEPEDEPIGFELPVKRKVMVRQSYSEDAERRFVVEIDVRLGQQLQTTEFTLTDRRRMTYPVLLGRAFLLDLYVVDVSRSYTQDRYDAT